MTNHDDQLDRLIRERLADKLDPQLGQARERFLREVGDRPAMRLADEPQTVSHRRLRLFGWTVGVAGAAIAAGIAIVMVLGPMLGPTDPTDLGPMHGPVAMNNTARDDGTETSVELTPVIAARDVEHALSWNTVDQGTIYFDGELPLRSLVRQASETVRWYDPQRRAHVEVTVPRDEVMLVGYPLH